MQERVERGGTQRPSPHDQSAKAQADRADVGWGKLDRPLQQIKLRGLLRVDWFIGWW